MVYQKSIAFVELYYLKQSTVCFTTQGSEKKVSFIFNVCTSKPSSKERHYQRDLYEISIEGVVKKKGNTRRPMFWLRVEEQEFVFKGFTSCAVEITKSTCGITWGKQICDDRGKETRQVKRFHGLALWLESFSTKHHEERLMCSGFLASALRLKQTDIQVFEYSVPKLSTVWQLSKVNLAW